MGIGRRGETWRQRKSCTRALMIIFRYGCGILNGTLIPPSGSKMNIYTHLRPQKFQSYILSGPKEKYSSHASMWERKLRNPVRWELITIFRLWWSDGLWWSDDETFERVITFQSNLCDCWRCIVAILPSEPEAHDSNETFSYFSSVSPPRSYVIGC